MVVKGGILSDNTISTRRSSDHVLESLAKNPGEPLAAEIYLTDNTLSLIKMAKLVAIAANWC